MLADLQFLASDALNLDTPLARAAAQAEIADAAWHVDVAWAKKLLREAYELTMPPEEEQRRLRSIPVGAQPQLPSAKGRAVSAIRSRVLEVANRDKAFREELARLAAQKLGMHEEQSAYVQFAHEAVANGDIAAASEYALKALNIDVSRVETIHAINEIAKKDRAAADNILLQYLILLRSFPVAHHDNSDLRTWISLGMLFKPHRYTFMSSQKGVPPPGAAAMREYVGYVIDTVSRKKPRQMQAARLELLSIWHLVRQYAPELTERFLDLEMRTRAPGEEPLPKTSLEDVYDKRYEKRMKEAYGKERADEREINAAINRGDFAKARKLIDKLDAAAQKTHWLEIVNLREALSLAAAGDTNGAQRLAAQLNKATSLLNVYPAIIEKCIAKKDHACAATLVTQAVRHLRQSDRTLAAPPAGIPASAMVNSKQVDPVLTSLSKLAKLLLPIDEGTAFEVLDEMIAAANRTEVEAGDGWTGFETNVFKAFAARNETRSLLAAQTLKERLRRIAALAAVSQWKAEELAPEQQARR
ncbi:MAG TPA: hypothetical protein VGV59_21775 [Pyrinomonadaceae bacterium]|nr:hypothetical protein [Pyrinomonadaceae bacterium]